MQNKIRYVVLGILLLFLALFYNYFHIMFLSPFGQHIWRQCDGASFMWTYTYVSMNFFEPSTINLLNGDGKMVAEFPIVYYIAACLNKLFVYHEWWIRVIHFMFFLGGLFCLSSISTQLTRNQYVGIILPLILFTSPIIVFYSNNYLPDVAAVSASIIGLYWFLKYRINHHNSYYFLSVLFFSLCGLLKPTALNVFLAMGVLWFFEQMLNFQIASNPIFRKRDFWMFFIVVAVVFLWNLFIIKYNKIHESIYIQAFVKPMWKPSDTTIYETYMRLTTQWFKLFIDFPFIYLGLIASVFCIIPFKKAERWISIFVLSLVLILVINTLMFYHQVFHHEYYLIVFIPLLLAAIILSYIKLNAYNFKYWNYIKIVFLFLFVFFLNMNMHRTHRYLYHLENNYAWDDAFQNYYQITPELRAHGISRNDKIVCWGDFTTSISLFLLDQRGYTGYYLPYVDKAYFTKLGVKYLVINNDLEPNDPRIIPLKTNLVFRKNKIDVYSLK